MTDLDLAIAQSLDGLHEKKLQTVIAVSGHAATLLDITPRFRFFTIHGKEHLCNLFRLLGIFRKGGIQLVPDDLFLLGLAICIHDLGMVTALRTSELVQLFEGKPIYPDPAYVENFVRERHHERIDSYIEQELGFLLGLGALNSPTGVGKTDR